MSTSQARAYIPDGYTENGLIKEIKNVHETVRFQYRPVLPESVRALMHNYFEKSAKAQGEIVDQTLMRQLIEWDLQDHQGSPLPINTQNLKRIKKPLKDRLFNIVTCFDGSDDDVDGSQVELNDESDLNFDELLSGESDGSGNKTVEQAKN